MAERARIVEVCDRYLDAVAGGDPDAVLDLFGDQPVIEDPVGSEPRVGRELGASSTPRTPASSCGCAGSAR